MASRQFRRLANPAFGLFAGAMKLSEAMDATEPEPEAEDTEEDEAKPSDPSPEPV